MQFPSMVGFILLRKQTRDWVLSWNKRTCVCVSHNYLIKLLQFCII